MSLSQPLTGTGTKFPVSYPGLLSVPRLTTLFASLLVALCSGTNYVYSAYAPQLGARLQITHTQLNIVGLAGNIGVYGSGPIWGRIVDTRGPLILLASAFLLLLTGYSGILYIFNAGIPSGAHTISIFVFFLLVLCGLMSGIGGNGGLTSAINSTAKTFPDRARGTAAGIVISGFGLSAFLFSSISHIAYAGNTSSFLRLLALGTSLPMVLGYLFVRAIPLPPSEEYGHVHESANETAVDEERRLLDIEGAEGDADTLEDPSILGVVPADISAPVQLSRRAALNKGLLPNVYGMKLFTSSDFWLLFVILSLLSGTGLMYINNVGSMSQALYFSTHRETYDPVQAATWQASQVSIISLMNFAGRIFIGLVSDALKHRWSFPRSYCLVLVSLFFLVSQIVAASVDEIHHLWMASALLGLAHGSTFSLFPTVCIEWFGLPHFSENWGYISVSPVIGGNFFSVAFGRNLDAHDRGAASHNPLKTALPHTPLTPTNSSLLAAPSCAEGRLCYVDTLYITVAACACALVLSVWAGLRDRRKLRAAEKKLGERDRESRVVVGGMYD